MSASMRAVSKDGIFATATGAVVLEPGAAAAGCSAGREHAETPSTRRSKENRAMNHLLRMRSRSFNTEAAEFAEIYPAARARPAAVLCGLCALCVNAFRDTCSRRSGLGEHHSEASHARVHA